ncbi:hypothetical protein LOK49_LG05G03682 [Camellia lanceoleosa]|uniref:Uncharacterized protein n=1 Tax=Camellia lanceoleosa TaxID=1840588 RepID=A0ACC0HM84_9ERIC|nr:hypothetical protein LOK49_LG05G03682 [Camellia lanceoleosa]
MQVCSVILTNLVSFDTIGKISALLKLLDIPNGVVVVLIPDMPDVLSHVSVRARNSKVCFATCFDPNILAHLQANEEKLLQIKPTSADIVYREVTTTEKKNLGERDFSSLKELRKTVLELSAPSQLRCLCFFVELAKKHAAVSWKWPATAVCAVANFGAPKITLKSATKTAPKSAL